MMTKSSRRTGQSKKPGLTGRGSPATLVQVAARAGVSPASVSRVLNRPETVGAVLKARVIAAIDELDYMPHGAARALASRRSYTIGAIMPTMSLAIFAGMVQVIQAALYETGYQLILASSEYDLDREYDQARTLIERRVDGLVLVGDEHQPDLYGLLERTGIPFVNTFSSATTEGRPSVGVDLYEAGYQLTRHLVELRHERFAILTSPRKGNDRISTRIRGTLACLADNGIELPVERIMEVPYGLSEGRIGFRALIESFPETTALVCTTDVLGIGAVLEANDQGLAVPQRLSITGFDDLELASQIRPRLTTVHVPARQIGRRSAEFLLARIEDRWVPTHTKLEASLIIRESTGAAAAPGG
jgi:LacI family transcriptional regulator